MRKSITIKNFINSLKEIDGTDNSMSDVNIDIVHLIGNIDYITNVRILLDVFDGKGTIEYIIQGLDISLDDFNDIVSHYVLSSTNYPYSITFDMFTAILDNLGEDVFAKVFSRLIAYKERCDWLSSNADNLLTFSTSESINELLFASGDMYERMLRVEYQRIISMCIKKSVDVKIEDGIGLSMFAALSKIGKTDFIDELCGAMYHTMNLPHHIIDNLGEKPDHCTNKLCNDLLLDILDECHITTTVLNRAFKHVSLALGMYLGKLNVVDTLEALDRTKGFTKMVKDIGLDSFVKLLVKLDILESELSRYTKLSGENVLGDYVDRLINSEDIVQYKDLGFESVLREDIRNFLKTGKS